MRYGRFVPLFLTVLLMNAQTRLLAANAAIPAHDAKIVMVHGSPTITVDGQMVPGVLFDTYAPAAKHFKSFADAGMPIVVGNNCASDASYGWKPMWLGPGDYDFSPLDSVMNMAVEANPDVFLMPRLYLWSPQWWQQANPGELRVNVGGEPYTGHALASEVWRKDAGDYLRAAVQHTLTASYGKRVIGYFLTSEETEEWFYKDLIGKTLDYSQINLRAFRSWLRDRYGSDEALRSAWSNADASLATAEIPSPKRRETPDIGDFFDPHANRQTIDYFQFFSWIMADSICHFDHVLKEATEGRALVGNFYGYTLQPLPGGTADSGHMALAKVLSCPDVDFLASPTCYTGREMGTGYTYCMSPTASVNLHGKLWVNQNDNRTHLKEPIAKGNRGFGETKSLTETIDMQWRHCGMHLTNGLATFWFDQQGGWFDDPAVMSEIGMIIAVKERALAFDRSSAAEIAVVVDEVSTSLRVENEYNAKPYEGHVALGHLGAPVDFLLIDDLAAARPHKFYIFKFCYRTSAKILAAVEQVVRQNGRVALWVDAPGMVNEEESTLSPENTALLTGLQVRPESGVVLNANVAIGGCNGVHFPTWTSFYARTQPTRDQLVQIARAAGVHLYVDNGDLVYANRSFLCLHSAEAGPVTVRLPTVSDVYDLRANRTVARAAMEFTVEARAKGTEFFFLGCEESWRK